MECMFLRIPSQRGKAAGHGPCLRPVAALSIALCLSAPSLRAQPMPAGETAVISAIHFQGNQVTGERTMLREIGLREGDVVSLEEVERARQAIQDLGLFRSVRADTEVVKRGVALRFVVREKYYLLPTPRLEANSDGDIGYGAQLRWSNLFGRNHSLRAIAVRRQFQEDDREGGHYLSATYRAPHIANTRYTLAVSGAHARQDSIRDQTPYLETRSELGFQVGRWLGQGPRTQGWTLMAGPGWQDQGTAGNGAPTSEGQAVCLGGGARFRDLHFDVYSERGRAFDLDFATTVFGAASDYHYGQWTLSYREYRPLNEPHRSLNFLFDAGGYHGGAHSRSHDAYGLGGSSFLRGYDKHAIEGDFYYYAAAEYLRPLTRKSVRLLLLAEAGSAAQDWRNPQTHAAFVSLGVGLRLRLTWFVNLELEMGVSAPLVAGQDSYRLFAGGV